MSDASDSELVRQMQNGSARAADVLFDRHWTGAWRAAYAVLGERAGADDAAQRAIERAIRSLDRFRDDGAFGPWLRRIAVNQAIDMLRRRRPEAPLNDEHPGPDPYAEIAERDALVAALGRLSEERRTVVAMRYWLDMDPPEIAEQLGVPVGTVSSRLSRALSDLRELLEVESR